MRMIRTFSLLVLPGAALLVAIFYPYGKPSHAAGSFILTLVAGFSTAGVAYGCWRSKPAFRVPLMLAAALALSGYFVCTTRQSFDEIVPMHFDGSVQRLYRSQNHQNPGMEVEDSSRQSIRVEPIPETSWKMLRVGDHVTKEAFTTDFLRDGERTPIVGRSLFHSVRGVTP